MKVILFLLIPVIVFSQALDSANVAPECEENKWSFGILFIPYYSGENFYYNFDVRASQISFSIISAFESKMESQFSYSVTEKLQIISDFSYYSNYAVTNINDYSSGHNHILDQTEDMQIVTINIGLKYYFGLKISQKVRPYLIGGIGKQIAFVNDKYNYVPYLGYIRDYKDNLNEFLKEINSPLLLNVGFGAEYFFNNSLSLNASLRFYYSSSSSTFEYESTFDTYISQHIEEIINEQILKQVGLGINFYF